MTPAILVGPNATVAHPSYMSLFVEMRFQETVLATGTGFVALGPQQQSILLTARHNVTGRRQDNGQPLCDHGGVPDRITVWNCPKGMPNHWHEQTLSLYDEEGRPLWIEHPQLGPRADFVGIDLGRHEHTAHTAFKLVGGRARILVGPAEPVSVVGYPFGRRAAGKFAIWATGFVATDLGEDFDDLPMFLIDCRSRKGQSGAPVIAYRHSGVFHEEVTGVGSAMAAAGGPQWRFLGLYSGRVNDESDLGYVWKAEACKQLVDAVASVSAPGRSG